MNKKLHHLKSLIILSILLPLLTHAFISFPTKIDTLQERKNIQTVLNTVMVPSPNLKVDGVLGKKSIQTIQAFQDSKGLVADGKIGPITRSTLESAQTGSSTTTTNTNTSISSPCSSGQLYNTQTGALCNLNLSTLPTGCNGTNLFSNITGVSCTKPITPGGGGSSTEPTHVIGGGGGGGTVIIPACTGLSTQSCTVNNGIGTQSRICNQGQWSNFGTCLPASCDLGYQEVNNICVLTTCTGLSTQSCTIINGTGNQSRVCTLGSWSSFGSCSPISCNAGYSISGNNCIVIPDTTKPTITSFTIPSTGTSLSVPISSLSAGDDKGVTGFLLNESSSTPNPSSGSWTTLPSTIYTFLSQGLKTLYAWAKDAAGNVSNAISRQTTITIPTTPTTITAVSSTSNDGHVDTNTLDRVFVDESRWSADGDGQYITYTLNQTSTVSYLRIAFYAASQRYFDIKYSTDGTNFSNALSSQTSTANMSNQYQTFSFSPVNAKYIRIVGHGNSNAAPNNGWISITETDINGFAVNLPATPVTPPVCVPESTSTTCLNKCGSQTNNCGSSVSCTACVTSCVPEATTTTCSGKCGAQTNNCGTNVSCTACTPGSNAATVVFGETFDNTNSTQPWSPYMSQGWWDDRNTLENVSGHGKVLNIFHGAGNVSAQSGVGNYRIPLDHQYKELYLSWDYLVPSDFDLFKGGKFFGGFAGGTMANIPKIFGDDTDGWNTMFLFDFATDQTYSDYNYFKSTYYEPGTGWPYGESGHAIQRGQWVNLAIRVKINSPADQSNGIFEIYHNKVLIYSNPHEQVVNLYHPEYLIDSVYFNNFFGGGGSAYSNPKDQSFKFDNVVAFYYPQGSSGYRSGASEAGRVLDVPTPIDYHPIPPNIFTPTTYTEKTGTINSHCAYPLSVDYKDGFQTSTIEVNGASQININVTKFDWNSGINYLGYKQILKVYQGKGANKVLKQTYGNITGGLTSPNSVTISGSSATLEWQAGGAGTGAGFDLNYTSDGTSSGSNFRCQSNYVASQ